MYGVYVYRRKSDGEILYIGIDKHIERHNRHIDHMDVRKRNQQYCNGILQKFKDEIEYVQLDLTDKSHCRLVEKALIKFTNPPLNVQDRSD